MTEYRLTPYHVAHIDELGNVFVISTHKRNYGNRITEYIGPGGYKQFGINCKRLGFDCKKIRTHHIVAECFLGPRPEGVVVNHKDGNKLNNAPGNLEYVTDAENFEHAKVTGLLPRKAWIDGRSRDYNKYRRDRYKEDPAYREKTKESQRKFRNNEENKRKRREKNAIRRAQGLRPV